MLETLDTVDFASLQDAYGPAVDVPARLRALAFGTVEEAEEALDALEAGIFHQGSYYPCAAPSVPFLIEIAAAPTPLRAQVLLFLSDMSGAPSDAPEPFDPFAFRSAPGAPDYPDAKATIAAIASGAPVYADALRSPAPNVRAAAAHLLSSVASGADALTEALAHEDDELTEIAIRLALARVGSSPAPATRPLASCVSSVIALRELDSEAEASLEVLLLEPLRSREALPFFAGDLCALALERLRPWLADERVFALLTGALATRLERGECFVEAPRPRSDRVIEEPTAAPAFPAGYGSDRPLRGIVAGLSLAAFGARASQAALLRREQLDDRMRTVLSLTVEHAVPVPVRCAPWITPHSMERFLAGGGPLDRAFTLESQSAPLYELLHEARTQDRGAGVEPLVRAVQAAWSAEELFELVLDLHEDPYDLAPGGAPQFAIETALVAHVYRKVLPLRARFETYATELIGRSAPVGAQARFALWPWIEACSASPAHLDSLASAALAVLRENGVPWLRVFPEPRRSSLVARLANPYLLGLFADECALLPAALLETFAAPDCPWWAHDAESALARVPVEALRELQPSLAGRRLRIVQAVLRKLTGEGRLTLTFDATDTGLRARLVDWLGVTRLDTKLSTQPMPDELAAVVRACADLDDPLVVLEGELDSTTEYRVMRLLSDAGFRGTVQAGTRSMRRTQ